MTYPTPRLRCIRPGEKFILRGEAKLRTLINTDRHHGYFEGGFASLCHVLDPVNLEWTSTGWRHESRSVAAAQIVRQSEAQHD